MSNLEGGIRNWRLMDNTAGIKIATAPTLFIKADITPAVSMMTAKIHCGRGPATCNIRTASISAMPVWCTAPLMINTAQTVMTAGLENPAKASREEISPVKIRANNTSKATTSTCTFSVTKSTIAPAKILSTSMFSKAMRTSCVGRGVLVY